ncbi:MAG: hypothetical protein ACYTFY_21385 [Planctomycetota bacterium]|jgi:hypothetical protein
MSDLGYLCLGVIAFIIMVIAFIYAKFTSPEEEQQAERRKQAMENLEEIRMRVQKKQGKFIDPDNLPPDVMMQKLEDESEQNAAKMAGTLKKIIE